MRSASNIFLDPVIQQKNADHGVLCSDLISLFRLTFYPLFHCNKEIELFGEKIFEI